MFLACYTYEAVTLSPIGTTYTCKRYGLLQFTFGGQVNNILSTSRLLVYFFDKRPPLCHLEMSKSTVWSGISLLYMRLFATGKFKNENRC